MCFFQSLPLRAVHKGAKVNTQGGYYGDALQTASHRGHLETVQLHLDNGANVNAQEGVYGGPLQAASEEGYPEIVQLLLEKASQTLLFIK